ncbi:DegT/DnrJ/EryC1/StrS family aminotransferase [Pontimonas sp.]|nr:DegT/DnrJ/EryC1/StrS family aminotransferase [Pontimonas sp.]
MEFLDLGWQTRQVKSEVRKKWKKVLGQSNFILSPHVAKFEQAFASFSGVAQCIGVGNGTDALEIAIRALGIGQGDEVIVPANSFVASAIAVSRAGATPVLVDCEPGTWLLDASKIRDSITQRTRAIMPVHLYGQMANMRDIQSIASSFNLSVIEDVAQAQGAIQAGRKAGSIGEVAGTSFYPGKNLGAMGDGGAVLTSSSAIMQESIALRNYGSPVKYEHPTFGFNSRLDSLQAVVLTAKLKRLQEWNRMRQAQAEFYLDALSNVAEIGLPVVAEGNEHVWHLFVIQVESRDAVAESMAKVGVSTGIHYPTPIHLLGMYGHLGHREGDFPVAERSAKKALSLPIYPGLSRRQQELVVSSLREALRS